MNPALPSDIKSYFYKYTKEDIARIAHSLGKSSKSSHGYMCLCPVHDDHNPSLSIAVGDDGKLLLHCFSGCDFKDVLQVIQDRELLPYNLTERKKNKGNRGSKPVRLAVMYSKQNVTSLQEVVLSDNQKASKEASGSHNEAKSIWDASVDISETAADKYLKSRGLDLDFIKDRLNSSLRFNNSVLHSFLQQSLPCLVAKVTDCSGVLKGLHQIFLSSEGKQIAKDGPSKLSLGTIKNHLVWLTPIKEKLVLTEGIEDGLTLVQCCSEYGVAAFLGANTSFDLPDLVKEVIIAADNDDAGQKKARKIKKRLQDSGKAVGISYLPKGKDC